MIPKQTHVVPIPEKRTGGMNRQVIYFGLSSFFAFVGRCLSQCVFVYNPGRSEREREREKERSHLGPAAPYSVSGGRAGKGLDDGGGGIQKYRWWVLHANKHRLWVHAEVPLVGASR